MTMTQEANPQTILLLSAGPNAVAEAEPAWEDRHILETRCPLCRSWREDAPHAPINAVLTARPRWLMSTTGLFKVVSRDLAATIVPYGRGIVLGTTRLAKNGELLEDLVTMYGTPEDELEVDRGRYSRHDQRRACKHIKRRNGWAHYVIVNKYLDERWLYLNRYDELFVDGRLIERENLRERFPKLRCYPIPIVPEPLDGEILPGDPGWTGTLVKTPLPKPPEHKPEKGIGLWL